MFLKKLSAPESPRDADAGKAGGFRGLHINLGVADVNGILPIDSENAEGFVGHVRSRLSPHFRKLAYGNIKGAGEDLFCQLLHGNVRFIRYDRRFHACCPKPANYLRNPGIRTGFQIAVCCIPGSENCLDPLHFFLVYTVNRGICSRADPLESGRRSTELHGQRPLNRHVRAASEKCPDIFFCKIMTMAGLREHMIE